MPAKHTQSKKNQPSNRPSMLFPLLLLGIGFGLGVVATQRLFAQSDSSQSIKACVKDNGTLRIVNTDTCEKNETLLVWNTQGPAGQPGATGATGLIGATGATGDSGADAPVPSERIIGGYVTTKLTDIDLGNANFSGQNMKGFDFSRSDMGGVLMSYADVSGSTFENTEMEGVSARYTNFSKSTFKSANLQNADVKGANFSDVTWINTSCPDGTNSNANGNTCMGHLGY